MKNKLSIALTLAVIMAMLVTSLALADSVVNNIDTTIDPVLESRTITSGGSTIVGFYIAVTNGTPAGDPNGCNATGSAPAIVTITVPTGVTASRTSMEFSGCGSDLEYVTFSSSTVGSYIISVASVTGGKSGSLWDTDPASFTLVVNPPADSTPPVITPNVSGTLGSNGWYVSDVNVSWTVSDPESSYTINSGCGSTLVNYDTAGVTFGCSATSAGGTNSQSVNIMRDATAPTISGSASPAPNGAGWNNSGVSVAFSCTDGISGIASCGPDQTLGSEGTGQFATGIATDKAGNSTSATVSGINIDLTAPTISGVASPAANSHGWNNTDVTVSFTCGDGLSGVASCGPNQTLSGEAAGQSVTGTAADYAGSSASATVSGIKIDKTAPVISAALDKTPAGSGWFNISTGVPTVSFTCGDALSGLDGACPADHTFGDGADQAYSQTVYDLAGNSASASVSNVDVDTVAPSISASISPAMPPSGWWNITSGAPTVMYTCSDSTSGLASCSAPFIFPEGADQSNEGFAADNAGNSNSASVGSIYVDLNTPSLNWNVAINNGDVFYFGFVPAWPPNPCASYDLLSGPASCAVTGYSAATGTHTLLATAYDVAGNSYSETRTYEVKAWTLNGFYKPVDMSGLITVWNTVKSGSTVPLKFEVFAGATEMTDTTAVKSLTASQANCNILAWEDAIETTATGGTSLRYDLTEGQFIYNWKTPKTPGVCYKVTMTTQDDSFLTAFFKLK